MVDRPRHLIWWGNDLFDLEIYGTTGEGTSKTASVDRIGRNKLCSCLWLELRTLRLVGIPAIETWRRMKFPCKLGLTDDSAKGSPYGAQTFSRLLASL